jgi:predicted HAD superfamily Cof-like phosphohydrolase
MIYNILYYMYQSNFEKVEEFHKVFQHPIKKKPDENVFYNDPKLVDLRLKLIKEEYNELTDAVSKSDLVEVVDALADLSYVIYGAGHAFGIDLNKSIPQMDSTKNKPKLNIFYTETKVIDQRLKLIKDKMNDLSDAISKSNITDVANTLGDLLYIIYVTSEVFGVELNYAFALVHESNMTKACKSESDAKDTIEEIKSKGVYKNPQYKLAENGKYWIVYEADTGKILKSKYYKAVDLSYIKKPSE